jgi:hypothetical protein
MTTEVPDAHRIYPMVVIFSKWPEYITTFSVPRSSKMYSNWYFWSEKKTIWQPCRYYRGSNVRNVQKLSQWPWIEHTEVVTNARAFGNSKNFPNMWFLRNVENFPNVCFLETWNTFQTSDCWRSWNTLTILWKREELSERVIFLGNVKNFPSVWFLAIEEYSNLRLLGNEPNFPSLQFLGNMENFPSVWFLATVNTFRVFESFHFCLVRRWPPGVDYETPFRPIN